jgi:hypothetical protein
VASNGKPTQNSRQTELGIHERALAYQKQNKCGWDDAVAAISKNGTGK